MDILKVAIPLILKALWLSARWAGVARARALQKTAKSGDPTAEIRFLDDRIAELETALALARIHGKKPGAKPRYTVKGRLLVIWYMEYFQAPRRQVKLSCANGTAITGADSSLVRPFSDSETRPLPVEFGSSIEKFRFK